MVTTVVRWGDLPHENVGRPTIYGNSNIVRSTHDGNALAVQKFESDWAKLKEREPEKYERLLYAIRGRRIACPGNCSFKGLPCHAQSLARMADELPDKRDA